MPPFVPSRTLLLPRPEYRLGNPLLADESDQIATDNPLFDVTSDANAAVPDRGAGQPQIEHEEAWVLAHPTPAEAVASAAIASDRTWLDALEWSDAAPATSPQPPEEPERVTAEQPPRSQTAELSAAGRAITADDMELGMAVPGAAAEDVLAEPLHDVADRLERIAGKLRRRSAGDLVSDAQHSDPLELLLTGFVLGYISRNEAQPRRREPDAG